MNINLNADQNYFRSQNEGNFLEMVQLLAGENADLAAHIKNCQEKSANGYRNQPTYMSPDFINKTLYVIRKHLVNEIVSEVNRNGGRFGLLMDGSQDITCQEQISVVIRYVNDTDDIVEHSILFFNALKTSGKGLYELLERNITSIGLSMRNIIGYSFDGASNMRSEAKGLSACINQHNKDSIYTWCLSHRFNLVIKTASSSSTQIQNILQLAEDSAKLFRGSYVRMNVWNDVLKTTPNISSRRKLKLIGTTRWSSKQDAISSIIGTEVNLYVLIKSLLRVCGLKNLEGDALVNASRILNSWLNYGNIVFIFVLHKIFSLTIPTTKCLQKNALSILAAIEFVRASKEKLENARENLNTYIQEAEEFIEKTNNLLLNDKEIVALNCKCYISLPIKHEKERKYTEIADDIEEFIIVLLDEMDKRILREFDDTEMVFKEMAILDPRNAEMAFADNKNEVSLEKLCRINEIANEIAATNELRIFTSDYLQYQNRPQFEAIFDDEVFFNAKEELMQYDEKLTTFLFEDELDIEETAADISSLEFQPLNKNICFCIECIMKYINSEDVRKKKFGRIYKIFKFVAILPSTQVRCERDFSKMKLIKNRLRSTMSEKSLENVMIISTEAELFKKLDLNQLIDDLVETSSRMAIDVGY